MAIATVGAFATAEYPEAVFVMLFYKVGELFEHMAVGKSRASIAALMEIMPEYANLEEDGQITETDPEDVPAGSVIVIKPGERVPLDGIVIEGGSTLNTMALTGESLPRDVAAHRDQRQDKQHQQQPEDRHFAQSHCIHLVLKQGRSHRPGLFLVQFAAFWRFIFHSTQPIAARIIAAASSQVARSKASPV